MSVGQPRLATVKRLFAVSRNQCAFGGCTAALVESSGTVTGEICHIKGKSKEGPRFDPSQTDEERHAFENLLLMCSIHHKVVDDKPGEFTVEKLLGLKANHEAAGPAFEPADEVAHAFLQNSGFIGDISQSSGDQGINVAATRSVVLVSAGLTYRDVKEIALDVYRRNALELRGAAETVAKERAEELTTAFLERLRAIRPEAPETLSDPDMQHVMFEAQSHAARAGNKELDAILVELLVDRATSPQRDLLQIVLGEAVETVGRLTAEQIDALTLVFILKYSRALTVNTLAQLGDYLPKHIDPFLHTAARSQASFQHLEYAGCGTLGIGARTLASILDGAYGHCFVTALGRTEFEGAVHVTEAQTEQLARAGCFSIDQTGTLHLAPLIEEETERLFRKAGVDPEAHKRFRQLITSRAGQLNSVEQLRQVYPCLAELEEWWKNLPSHFQLTSVGIAIGHANLRRRGIEGFDLRVWIN